MAACDHRLLLLVRYCVHAILMDCDYHLIVDICMVYSTKWCTHERRASVAVDHPHHLILQSPSHHRACLLLSSTPQCSKLTSYVRTCQHTSRIIYINVTPLVLSQFGMKLPWEYISRDMTYIKVMRRQTSLSSIK